MKTQSRLLPALACVHNFIRHHNPDDIFGFVNDLDDPHPTAGALSDRLVNHAETTRAKRLRDEIAQAMWDDYQNVLRTRDFL